ncbi:MAG: DUF3368 domain-containing protein [Lachnospiraceae bacterium]|nr:DUF3368 domain-containing protein [Lachnospiraceae bacterium]
MIIVSDTTPIISLLKINRLDLLEKLFGEVLIPNAVYEELTADKRFIDEAKMLFNVSYIKSVSVSNPEAVRILRMATGLDQGESEAIVLTDELKADILLMDEAKGRKISGQMGITIMGTIGLLISAYEDRIITSEEVRRCIDDLQRSGRHIGERHYQMLLDRLQ